MFNINQIELLADLEDLYDLGITEQEEIDGYICFFVNLYMQDSSFEVN